MRVKTLALGFLGVFILSEQSLGGTSTLSLEDKIALAKTRCAPPQKSDPILFNIFKFGMSQERIDELYPQVYGSSERLLNRVGYKSEVNSFVSKKNEIFWVAFPEYYIKSIILQVENALRLNYAKYIFFPDMGHSHILIPLDYYEENITGKEQNIYESLNVAFQAPNLKTLYHTAEQLGVFDENKALLLDRYIQWRFYTRNPIGDAVGNIEIHTNIKAVGQNTVRDLKGHRYFTGFNISANKNGCFPFEDAQGQIQYFDLSVWDLPYKLDDYGEGL